MKNISERLVSTKSIVRGACSLLLLGLFGLNAVAQTAGEEVEVARTVAGNVIKAKVQRFDHNIHKVSVVDTLGNYLVQFRDPTKSGKYLKNKGTMAFYHLGNPQPVWSLPLNYQTNTVYAADNGILFYDGNKRITHLLSLNDGASLWTTTANRWVMVDEVAKRLLAYKGINGNKLAIVNLETGQEIATQKVTHEYAWGWNDVYKLDSLRFICIADDINLIDMESGGMTFHKAKTGITDTKQAILQGLLAAGVGIGLGLAGGGGYYMPTAGIISSSVITGLTSQIWEQDSLLYIADRNGVMCFDRQLNERWNTPLPPKLASKSILYGQDSTLYMLNLGFGLRGGQIPRKTGRPFIAAFDARTGRQLFLNQLTTKKDIVEDAFLTPDHAFMLFDDGLAYQANLNDSVVDIMPWDALTRGKLYALVKQDLYGYHEGEQVFRLIGYDGVNCPVMNDSAHVYLVDRTLQIHDDFPAGNLYVPMSGTENYVLVRKIRTSSYEQPDYWVIHRQGIPVTHITFPCTDIGLVGNTLFFVRDKELLQLPIAQLME